MNSSSRGLARMALRLRTGSASLKVLTFISGLMLLPLIVLAATPASGTISPSTAAPLTFTGTASGTGSAAGEDSCVEGVNCDTYTLTVSGSESSWANNIINVKLSWKTNVHDYDLYIHKDSNSGPEVGNSAGGAPQTEEATFISPSKTGVGVYTIHVVYFTQIPQNDQPVGTISVGPKPKDRFAFYTSGGITFSPNTPCLAPVASADGEPSSRTDKFGNHYVAGIRGVPAGIDLWYFDLRPNSPTYDPYMRNPIYRGQPDAFSPTDALQVGNDGGGDVDLAVGMDGSGPNNVPTLAMSSLVVGNISTQRSQDLGNSFTKNVAGNVTGGVPVDDRQWHAFYGKDVVYMFYRTFNPAYSMIQRSTDGGLTYGPARTAGAIGQAGAIDVDQNDGTVYISGSTGQVAVGIPDPTTGEPLQYTVYQATNDPAGVANLFFVIKVGPDGTVYGAYSNNKHVYLIHSKDKGKTWSQPVRVDDGKVTTYSVFPALAAGPIPNSVAVAWYGSPNPNDDTKLPTWRVFMAQSFNATDDTPTFRQAFVSDHVIHGENISFGGTLGNANRNLLDYFQISFDPLGALVVDYADDHNDFSGHTFVTRQISGPSAFGTKLDPPKPGPELPGPRPYSLDGSQVVDFEKDVAYGLLLVFPSTNSLDIRKIKYSSAPVDGTDTMITAKMTVGTLYSIPKSGRWRMCFSVNCPYTGLNATRQYSNAVSDRGDQLWVAANTDAQGKQTFTFGTTVRNGDGSLTYTSQGTADAGAFDMTNNTITVSVKASKLNPFVTKGPKIGSGTILAGLRGTTSLLTSTAAYDDTRGGLEYKIP